MDRASADVAQVQAFGLRESIMEPTIPIELLEQFERENVLLFVSEGINRGRLPSSAELARELAQRCEYPDDEPLILPRVAGYYEMIRDRNSLVTFLRDRLEISHPRPSRAHQLIARLNSRTIVTTCYDRLLEHALLDGNVPYVAVVGNEDVAFAEEHKTLLVWIWGVLDRADSLVITEDDRRTFLENRGNLSDVLRGELARRTWLFLGFDLEDEWFRDFYDTVQRGLDHYRRRAYVFGATPGTYTRLWWEKRNVNILEVSVTQFLEMLVEQLTTDAHPPGRTILSAIEAPSAPLPDSPYKRLDYYGEQDRALFWGRDREIERLAALIHAHRLVLVYGASGTGKTSLLQAGVIPRLKYSEPGYAVIAVRALEDVRVSIHHAIARQIDDGAFAPGESLLETLDRAIEKLGPIVLVIDQFEEFFVHLDVETRRQIVDELAMVYEAQDVPVKIVFSLREDYLARMGELETRIVEVFRVRFQLQPLTLDQAQQAIVQPVEMMGNHYEPALVDRLLADLMDEGVMPPQLQLVCSTLYDHLAPHEHRITLAHYEEMGGVAGILKEYLTGELARLGGPERALARGTLKELIDAQGNKRVSTEDELCWALGVTPAQLEPVVEKLVRSHLIRPFDLAQRGETGYELAHEYLVGEIASWFDPLESERKQVYELLRQDIDRWQRFRTPIAGTTLDMLVPHWPDLILQPEERLLVLRSAIQQDWHARAWIERLENEPGSSEMALDLLHASDEAVRYNAACCWRLLPADAGADEALAGVALDDPVRSVRAEAAISLAHRSAERGVVLIADRSGAPPLRQVRALAYIWDETAPIRQLSPGLGLSVLLDLARIRLGRSGRALIYHSVAGVITGITIGVAFALLASPLAWLALKPEWEATGYTLPAVIAWWFIFAPWGASIIGTALILISTLPLVLLKRPKRWIVLLTVSLVVASLCTLMITLVHAWGFQIGTLWQGCLLAFVAGAVLGGATAELFYRRYFTGHMPSPLVGSLCGLVVGLFIGFFRLIINTPNYPLAYWMAGTTFASLFFIGGITLVIGRADRFIPGLSPTESKGGWFK